jgi:hypothetical protein
LGATAASCSDFGIVKEYFLTLIRGAFDVGFAGAVDLDFPFQTFLIAALVCQCDSNMNSRFQMILMCVKKIARL